MGPAERWDLTVLNKLVTQLKKSFNLPQQLLKNIKHQKFNY